MKENQTLRSEKKMQKNQVVFRTDQEINVELERRPIYATHGYVETAKRTKRILVIEEVLDGGKYRVRTKGHYRQVGSYRVPLRHALSMNRAHDFGTMHNQNTKYEVEILQKKKKVETASIKGITRSQLKVLMRDVGTQKPINHGVEKDEAHEDILIPVYGRHENKSGQAMERKGWGYMTVKQPHDHGFFRPIKGLIQEAKNHPESRWV